VSVNCFTIVIYIVIVGSMMCFECCFTIVIYNVMTIILSSCCMYTWNNNPSLLKLDKEAVEGFYSLL
jgi:hypothetical protein